MMYRWKLLFVASILASTLWLLAGCGTPQESFATPTLALMATSTSTRVPTSTATLPALTPTPAPSATITPTTMPEMTPTRPAEAPLARAAYIQFERWSPDSLFFAFWASDTADREAQLPYTMPGGVLTFFDVTNKTICSVETLRTAYSGEASLFWQADGAVIIRHGETIFTGKPCGNFTPLDDFTAPFEAMGDPGLSPDGRYRVSNRLVDSADGLLNLEITFYEGERPLYNVDWSIPERLGDYTGWTGGSWVSPTEFVIYETAEEGPLLLDAEVGVTPVLSALFGIDAIPTFNNDGYSLSVHPLPDNSAENYRLLLYRIGIFDELWQIMLFHAKTGLVETLPASSLWWTPVVDGWLILNEVDFPRRGERNNLLRRRIEDVGGAWEYFALDVDYTLWDEAYSQLVWIQAEDTVIWQTWPDGELLGRYNTKPFWVALAAFSPDGDKIVLRGNIPGQWNSGLFLITR